MMRSRCVSHPTLRSQTLDMRKGSAMSLATALAARSTCHSTGHSSARVDLGRGDISAEPLLHGEPRRRVGSLKAALVWILVLVLASLGVAATSGWWPGEETSVSLPVEESVKRALDLDAAHTAGRLLSTKSTAWGDVTVEFVLTDQGNVRANRAAAMADAVAIMRAVYMTPGARPLNVTLLGVALRSSAQGSYVPVLYAALPADQMVATDWARLPTDDLVSVPAVRWLPTGTCLAWGECDTSQISAVTVR